MIHRPHHHRPSLWSRTGLWLLAVLLAGTTTASADWPMNRQNPQRTATATKASDLAKPALRWRKYLGGSINLWNHIAFDVDGDGVREILYISGGRLIAKTPLDELVYETPFLSISRIDGFADFDGDGEQELVVSSNTTYTLHILAPKTGAVLWTAPFRNNSRVTEVRYADFNKDGRTDLYISPQRNGGDAYEFSQGFADGTLLFSLEPSLRDYNNAARNDVVADIDGDGDLEIVAQGSKYFYVYSTIDGSLECTSPDIGYIPYGQAVTRVADVDGDGRPEIAAFTRNSDALSVRSRRVFLMDYDETTQCVISKWDRSVTDLETQEHQHGVPTLADLDGDGDFEIVTSFGAGTTWQTVVLDANTGAQLAVADVGPYQGIIDVTDDGKPEIFSGDPQADGLRGYSFSGDSLELLWHTTDYNLARARDWNLPTVSVAYAGTRLQAFDVTGDGNTELIVRTADNTDAVTVAAISFVGTPHAVASITLPEGTSPLAFEQYPDVSKPYAQLLLPRSDGYLLVLDKDFAATNFSDSEEFPLRGLRFGNYYSWAGIWTMERTAVAADLDNDNAAEVLIRNSTGDLLRLEPTGANLLQPPTVTWSLPNTTYPSVFTRSGAPAIAAMTEAGSDARLVVYDGNGTEVWRLATPYITYDLVVDDLDGTGDPEIVYMRLPADDADVQINAIHSADSTSLWPAPFVTRARNANLGGVALGDQDGDGLLDVVAAESRYLWWRSGLTGASLRGAIDAFYTELPMLYDLVGDERLELFSGGSNGNLIAWTIDTAEVIWTMLRPTGVTYNGYFGAIAPCSAGPRLVTPNSGAARLQVFDATVGTLLADIGLADGIMYPTFPTDTRLMGEVGHITMSPDLVGTGRPSALVGSTDGFLYALDVCGDTIALDWAMDFRSSVGQAVFADTDGDGYDEILVTAADGYLYAIDTEALPAPGYVIDRDSLTVGDDIDQLETNDTLWAQWEPVAEATSYQYAVVTQGGTIITTPDFIDAGNNTLVAISGLDLALNTTYRVAVRAINAEGTSAEVMSDGVTVMDGTAPRIENLAATPTTFSPLLSDYDDTTVISGTLVDGRALASATWEVEDAAGQRVLAPIALQDVTGTEYHLAFSWDAKNTAGEVVAPGNYSIKVTVTDAENYWTTGSVIVTVADETTGMPDAGPVVGSDAGLGQVRVDDGCNCTVGDRGPSASGLLLTFLVLLGARRRRNRNRNR